MKVLLKYLRERDSKPLDKPIWDSQKKEREKYTNVNKREMKVNRQTKQRKPKIMKHDGFRRCTELILKVTT